jgi:hypothetical protein
VMVQLVVAREYHEGVTRCCSTGNGRKWRKAQAWRCADYEGEGEGGATQVQPAFASVTSETPGEIAVGSEGTSPADGIALGLDGDAQAAIPNVPSITNRVQTRLNTCDILDLL